MTITEALMDAANEDQFDADWYLLEADEDAGDVVIPVAIQQAAQAICTEHAGFVLTSIKPETSGTYTAWYIDTTAHPEEDWYIMCREFQMVNNKAVDLYDVVTV